MHPAWSANKKTVSLVLAFTLALMGLCLVPALPATQFPYHVRLTWQHDPRSTATVTWDTDPGLAGYAPAVSYGTAPGDYTSTAFGTSHSYGGATVDVRDVELTGLVPGTRYYYTCGDAGYGWSPEKSFSTAPAPGEGFTFCALGDSREGIGPTGDNSNFEIWGKVANAASAENPALCLFAGDAVTAADSELKWNAWYDKLAPLSGGSATMPCVGNHEGYRDAYLGRFALPGNERWYSYDVASVHFVCLDTGLSDSEPALIAEQSAWLDNDLAAARARGCDWTAVLFHRSPYAEGGHGNMQDVIDGWVPIFDRYNVDIVFAGHDHFYQRTYPLRAGAVADAAATIYRRPVGTIYVTTGGAGAPITGTGAGPRIAAGRADYNYCVVQVQPANRLTFKAKLLDGSVIDHFTLDKSLDEGSRSWYFAEGYTGPGFQEYLSLANFSGTDARALVTYFFNGQGPQEQAVDIGANSRATVNVNEVLGEGKEVSTRVESDLPLVAERPMYFTYQGKWAGGHDVIGAKEPGKTWYFAEGTTREGFEEWITVLNPSPSDATVAFRYMVEGEGPVIRSEAVGANSRRTFRAADHLGPGKDASLFIESNQDIVAERPEYFAYAGLAGHDWQGGHCVVGAPAPSKAWYFAEGSTRDGFEEWLCLQNPNPAEITVTGRYTPGQGQGEPVEVAYRVPALQRVTISVNGAVGPGRDISVELGSASGFIAERPVYFMYHGAWDGGHDCLGASSKGTRWLFAEGYTAPSFDEWLCLFNPAGAPVNVFVTYMTESGEQITRLHVVGPLTRYTIPVDEDAGSGLAVAARVSSSTDIVAERPMYFDYDGRRGGHCAAGFQPW